MPRPTRKEYEGAFHNVWLRRENTYQMLGQTGRFSLSPILEAAREKGSNLLIIVFILAIGAIANPCIQIGRAG